jgi:hypothetical protein
MFCCPCIIRVVYQYSTTNVMHFLFSLLRIKGLYKLYFVIGLLYFVIPINDKHSYDRYLTVQRRTTHKDVAQ